MRCPDSVKNWYASTPHGRKILALLLVVVWLMFYRHLYLWCHAGAAESFTVSKVTSVMTQGRGGTYRRYEIVLKHNGVFTEGYVETWWYCGKPAVGEAVKLRRERNFGGEDRFYYASFFREFCAWGVLALLSAVVLGLSAILRRRGRRQSGGTRGRQHRGEGRSNG